MRSRQFSVRKYVLGSVLFGFVPLHGSSAQSPSYPPRLAVVAIRVQPEESQFATAAANQVLQFLQRLLDPKAVWLVPWADVKNTLEPEIRYPMSVGDVHALGILLRADMIVDIGPASADSIVQFRPIVFIGRDSLPRLLEAISAPTLQEAAEVMAQRLAQDPQLPKRNIRSPNNVPPNKQLLQTQNCTPLGENRASLSCLCFMKSEVTMWGTPRATSTRRSAGGAPPSVPPRVSTLQGSLRSSGARAALLRCARPRVAGPTATILLVPRQHRGGLRDGPHGLRLVSSSVATGTASTQPVRLTSNCC